MENLYIKRNKIYITPNCFESKISCINQINMAIENIESDICIDLCGFNIFTAIHISSVIGANELVKNKTNEIEVLIDNEVTLNYIKLLKLSNMKLTFLQEKKLSVKI